MNSDKQKQIMLSKLLSKLNNLIKKKRKKIVCCSKIIIFILNVIFALNKIILLLFTFKI